MITNFLAAVGNEASAISVRGTIMLVIMLFIYVGITVLVISLMVRLVKYLGSAGKERKLLRIELGKLADEVRQMREQKQGVDKDSARSVTPSETKK